MAEQARYRLFEHPADIGIEAFGQSPAELFENAAFALFDVIADLEAVQVRERREVSTTGEGWDDLFINWLRELLYLHSGEEYLFREFRVTAITDGAVCALIGGERLDPARHGLKVEVKAVTYHQARAARQDGSWLGRFILDI